MTLDVPPLIQPVTASCISQAAQAYRIHEDIQYAILIVEGGTTGKTSAPNANNTYDIGPAQINSMHLPLLKEAGISEKMITNDGCLNIYVQAYFIAEAIRQAGPIRTEEDYLFTIARYHSKTPSVAAKYVHKLKEAFQMLYTEDAIGG